MDKDSTFDLDEDAIATQAGTERLRIFNERCITGAKSAPLGIVLLLWCWRHGQMWFRPLWASVY